MATLAQTKRPSRKAAIARGDLAQAGALLGLMAVVAVPAGVNATYIAQDVMVGVVAAALTALMLIALLQMLGVLGGR